MPAKQTKLEAAIAMIEKRHGKDSAVCLDRKDKWPNIPVFSSASLSLDLAIGCEGRNYGFPRGRIIEVFGPESGGKSTLVMQTIGMMKGEKVHYIDAEYSFDPVYATRLGVDVEKQVILSQPLSMEDCTDIALTMISSGAVAVVLIDSVAAMAPKAVLEGEMGDSTVGLFARLMGQFLEKAAADVSKTGTTLILINQIREKIGGWGNPETTPGGRALKHWCSLRIDVRRTGSLKKGNLVVGARTKAVVVKSKIGPPKRKGEYDFLYQKGISREGEILDLGVNYGVVDKKTIEKKGPYYVFSGNNLGLGREVARTFLEEAPEIAQEIEAMILKEDAKNSGFSAVAENGEEAAQSDD